MADVHKMHKYAQFECYAKLNWKPVQTLKLSGPVTIGHM